MAADLNVTEEKLSHDLSKLLDQQEAGTIGKIVVQDTTGSTVSNRRTFAAADVAKVVKYTDYVAADKSGAAVLVTLCQDELQMKNGQYGRGLYEIAKLVTDQQLLGATGLGFGSLLVAGADANGDILYTAKDPGPGSADITVEHVVSGLNTARSIVVTGTAIVVNVATDGAGAVAGTETATAIAAAVNGNAAAAALVGAVAQGTGASLVDAAAAAPLSAGADSATTANPKVYLIKRSKNDTTPRAALLGATFAAAIGL